MIRITSVFALLLLVSACGSSQRIEDAARLRACIDPPTSLQEAVSICTALIDSRRLDSDDSAEAHYARGAAFDAMGNSSKAMSDFDRVIALTPGSPSGYLGRGILFAKGGAMDKALRDFEQAARLDPNNVYALLNIANAHERLGDLPLALKYVDQVLALKPDLPKALEERCWVRAVMKEALVGALDDCNRALQDPAFADKASIANLHNSLGLVHFQLGQYAEAIADYDRSLELAPNVASSHYMRGIAKRALEPSADADNDVARGIALEASVAERYSRFGVAR